MAKQPEDYVEQARTILNLVNARNADKNLPSDRWTNSMCNLARANIELARVLRNG